jgi:hypothetical protein
VIAQQTKNPLIAKQVTRHNTIDKKIFNSEKK